MTVQMQYRSLDDSYSFFTHRTLAFVAGVLKRAMHDHVTFHVSARNRVLVITFYICVGGGIHVRKAVNILIPV